MPQRNWKKVRPTSLREAMRLCTDYALAKHNRSIPQIAELMGLSAEYTLYKWMSSGRMPAQLIRPFEHACDAEFVTQYLGASARRLVVPIPRGRAADGQDIQVLQSALTDAAGELLRFYRGEASAEETLGAIDRAMGGLAYQRANVEQYEQPSLALDDETEGE